MNMEDTSVDQWTDPVEGEETQPGQQPVQTVDDVPKEIVIIK